MAATDRSFLDACDEIADVQDPERIRRAQLEAEIKLLRRENSQYEKALAEQEQFFERIVEATRIPVHAPKLTVPRQNKKLPARSVVVPIYDQQYGQLVRPSDTPGEKGEYSATIYDQRAQRWFEGVTGHMLKQSASYRLDELIVVLGGDHLEGDEIYPGMSWQLEFDPMVGMVELAAKMGDEGGTLQQLIRFAKHELGIPYIMIVGIPGNHGKVGGRKSGARPKTYNWDYGFQAMLRDKLRAEPVDQFVLKPAGSVFFYAAGYECQAIHGEQIRGWGGIPFYGIARHDAKSVRLHNRMYRYLFQGHIHQQSSIAIGSGAKAIISGDWVGANNMSGEITAASRPEQQIVYFAQSMGVTEYVPIYLTEADEALNPSPIYGKAAA